MSELIAVSKSWARPDLRSIISAGDLLYEFNDAPPQFPVANTDKSLGQRNSVGARQIIRNESWRYRLCFPARIVRRGWRAVEEKRDRHLQNVGNFV